MSFLLRRSGLKGRAAAMLIAGMLLVLPLFLQPSSNPVSKVLSVSAAYAEQAADAKVEGKEGEKDGKPKFMAAPKLKEGDYPYFKTNILGLEVTPRILAWLIAQLHLWFAAFVLAVPIFVLLIEAIGIVTKNDKYDDMAHEFIKVSMTAFSITSITGGVLAMVLFNYYPDFMKYLMSIFGDTMIIYAMLFFGESGCLYIYYYGWDRMRYGTSKWVHLSLGMLLNAFGMTILFISNAWTTFMMAPSGVDGMGAFTGNIWEAIRGPLWNPINLHRFIANIAYGGSIVGAYAAYKFLAAQSKEERAHYDWMGYTSNFIAIAGLLPLPFAGYWLTAEMYAYSQQVGITLMGGLFAWLFIVQAVLIGSLFLAANYYLWCGMGRSEKPNPYFKYVKYIAFAVVVSFLVWFTPHTLIMTAKEAKIIGSHHPVVGVLGVMSAKNTAVNILIIATYLSFMLYRRGDRVPTVGWAKTGDMLQAGLLTAACINILWLGIYGYLIPANVRIGLSIPQVFTTLLFIILSVIIDGKMYKGAKAGSVIEWGKMPARSQYALFLLAVSFTWLMGLMGFCRSGIRQHWHVYTVMRDNSPDAFTPTLPYAASVVSVGTVIFMALVIFIFWLAQFSAKKQKHEAHGH
ncbi:MAG: cytochrome ubiquinol oxidase subunit I [Nitrospirota bacterium]|nr:cytochrome ubiquinol oxidase subunit I [Nitrospirota bacterium]